MIRSQEKIGIEHAVEILKKGGVIAYPAETVYGLGCDPFNEAACERIQALKERSVEKTMLLLACSREQIETMAGELNGITGKLAEKFWPGPLTIILKPKKNVPVYLLGKSQGIAFRVTSSPVASVLAKQFGVPIISTSANLSGKSPAVSYEQACEYFAGIVGYIVESKERLTGIPSTIIDVTSGRFELIREGTISLKELQKAAEDG